MSMLSSQVDELRELATRYYELQVGAVKAVKMPSNMGSILREAADTIRELCDDLQRAHRENAKLREELADVPKCETCEAMLDCDECLRADCSHKERRRLSVENERLRELARDMWRDGMCECDERGACAQCEYHFPDRMRELGVEVDG